ncbi:MAG: hypothetical protein BroJett014_27910 [Planctomycetota bacterium]|nr:MAG: hypothetical protein BroJett014_27910 [Planctomycetota bacterium]
MHRKPAYPAIPSAASVSDSNILDPSRVAHLFPPQLILQWFHQADHDRLWRDRRLPRPVLFLGALLHALHGRGNFAHALDDAAQLLRPDTLWQSISAGSVNPARKRLDADVLELGRRHIVSLYDEVGAPSPLPPFRVLCVDGTTFAVADSKANAIFGYPGCARGLAGNPSLRACFVMDAASHLFIEAVRAGYREASEQELGDLAIALTAEPGVLFELDRGYYSVIRLRSIVGTGAHALCRVPRQVKLPVLKRMPDGSYLSFVRHNSASRTLPCGSYDDDLLLRVIEYDILDRGGQRREFRLVTTVTDWRMLPARNAAQGYHLRWREEVGIRELKWMKKRFAHPCFGGKSPEIVAQEFEAMLLAHASVRLLMAHAAKERGIDPTRLSLSGAIAVIGRFLQAAQAMQGRIAYDLLVSELARQKLYKPNGRVCPRTIKSKRSKFPTRARGSPCSSYPRLTLKLKRP